MALNITDEEQRRTISRRGLIIGTAQGGLLMLLGARLGWLQLAQGSRYAMLSDKNRIDLKMLPPERGRILDRNGALLASNEQNFRVVIVPEQAKDPRAALEHLRSLIDVSDLQIEDALDNIRKVAKFSAVEVKDQLSWEELSRIEVNLPHLPGLSIEVGDLRTYTLGPATSHLIGYVAAPDEDEVKQAAVLSLPGFKTGRTGLERALENDLRGREGFTEIEVNATGRSVQEINRYNSLPGQDTTLTIDATLQAFMQDRLSSVKSASAVVMDTQTGAVYGLASHPAFDPNEFVSGISHGSWQKLLGNPAHPLNNKATVGQYPPASTFKMVVILAALKAGIITPETKVHCSGKYNFKGKIFHCWKHEGHGSMDAVSAIAESCDTYFYDLATKMNIDDIAAMARSFGLGERYDGFELPEQAAGLVPDKNWKMGHDGKIWQPGETIIASIGQGYLLATPLQLTVMTARLVNGGFAVEPWLIANADNIAKAQSWPKIPVNPAHLDLVVKGMGDVVNADTGTARGSRIGDQDLTMGGKTGTAQVKRITMAQRLANVKNEDLNWKSRHHALFVSCAPIHKPRYACTVVFEHGVSGSRAAPIARDILLEAQRLAPAKTVVG